MYVVIASAMLSAYVSSPDVHLAPGVVKFLPDLVSAVLMVYIFVEGVRQQFRYVNVKYWLIFGALALTILCGPLVNQEDVGPIVAGIRYCVRAIPLFFLPAVVNFSDRDVQRYLKFLLALSLLQVPISAYQRVTGVARGLFTGDLVIGTLMNSGVVSLFLISVMCVMAALMLRGRISKIWFGVCFVLMMIAVSINETKMTFLVLPLALLVTFFVVSPPRRRLLVTLQALGLLIVAGAISIPLYDALSKRDDGTPGYTIIDFFTDRETVTKYMALDAGVGTGKEAGRGDSLEAPFRALSNDPIKFVFGLGIGNVSKSGIGEQFSGRYTRLYWNYAQEMSASAFLFEIGLLGTGLVLLLHWMVLRDALFVAKHDDGLVGILALGYVGAWLTITIGFFYTTIHTFESLSFMFWFFSGLFAAHRQRVAMNRTKVKAALNRAVAPMKLKVVSAS